MLWAFAAGQYYQAAAIVRQRIKEVDPEHGFLPIYSLCGHSIELSAKAYLRAMGHSIDQIRAGGHDLMKLIGKANTVGGRNAVFGFATEADFGVLVLLDHYYKIHSFRYPEVGHMTPPKPDLAIALAKRFFEIVEPICKANNDVHVGKPTAVVQPQTKHPKLS